MKAILLDRHGGPDVLRVRDVPAPQPGPGEVRVRLRTIGLNWAEVVSRKGLYGWAPPLPYVPGMEGFGTIDAVGAGVERAPGERVIVGAQYGSYAERVVVAEHQALPAIEGFSDEENAAFAVNYMTAWVALVEMARLRPSDRVLVTAAAGGVGTAAVQIAKHLGCRVHAAAGSDDKLELLRRLGAVHTVNYRRGSLESELRAATEGAGVDVALELIGGEVYRQSLRSLAPFGRVVVAGFASLNLKRWNPLSWWRTWRDIPRAQVRELATRSAGVLATHIGYLLPDRQRLAAVWRDLAAFTRQHDVRPIVGARFGFEQMGEAHALLESRTSTGKLVVDAP